jgi:hypothetical protein
MNVHCDHCNQSFRATISLHKHRNQYGNGSCSLIFGARPPGRPATRTPSPWVEPQLTAITANAQLPANHLNNGNDYEDADSEGNVGLPPDEVDRQAVLDEKVWRFITLCNAGQGLNGTDSLSLFKMMAAAQKVRLPVGNISAAMSYAWWPLSAWGPSVSCPFTLIG